MPVENILTIDVEDWFQVEVFSKTIGIEKWSSQKSRLLPNILKILDILKAKHTKATFFVLGWVGEKFPEIVSLIQEEGHEIGSHGYAHQLAYTQKKEEFETDLRKSLEILEKITGEKVIGYRAPSFSITQETFWVFDILSKWGIKYDSSIFPIRHSLYGIPDAPRFPFTVKLGNGGHILEFPLSTVRILGKNFPFGGGGYLRIFPYWYTRWAVKKLNRQQKRVVTYFHPWEIDPHQPKQPADLFSRFRHYTNLSTMESKLKKLLDDFQFSAIREVWKIS